MNCMLRRLWQAKRGKLGMVVMDVKLFLLGSLLVTSVWIGSLVAVFWGLV